ncbi:hypothetical protein [Acrocarpospora sp. B8E8]|uniref:hypothetical protein n=1 Tax=Acrocarpospora sp. B8E8 TaxID=3153572 RepID=UPI00325FCA4A
MWPTAAFPQLYKTAAERQTAGETINSPAGLAFTGPAHYLSDYTYGSMLGHQMLGFMVIMVGIMSVLMVARHTRTEEETGRAELVRAAIVGRHALGRPSPAGGRLRRSVQSRAGQEVSRLVHPDPRRPVGEKIRQKPQVVIHTLQPRFRLHTADRRVRSVRTHQGRLLHEGTGWDWSRRPDGDSCGIAEGLLSPRSCRRSA